MTIDQMLIVGSTFGAVVLAGYFVSLLLASRGDEKHIRDRLREKPRPLNRLLRAQGGERVGAAGAAGG